MEISMYLLKIHYSQGTWEFPCTSKGTSERVHGNFHVPLKVHRRGYMEISMYLLKIHYSQGTWSQGSWEFYVPFKNDAGEKF